MGPDRDQKADTWRHDNHSWGQRAPWRGNRNWWRNNSHFHGYTGPRLHYFFFPGFGYVMPPIQYWGHQWRAGDYLPSWFWRYRIIDYWDYGLPAPPPGCSWVWLDHGVALVDMSDGYIMDIEYGVW